MLFGDCGENMKPEETEKAWYHPGKSIADKMSDQSTDRAGLTECW